MLDFSWDRDVVTSVWPLSAVSGSVYGTLMTGSQRELEGSQEGTDNIVSALGRRPGNDGVRQFLQFL